MPKLIKNKYYNSKGDYKVSAYMISISKAFIEASGLDPEKNCEVKAEKGKVIITQK